MNEKEFLEMIDCKFPYNNKSQSIELTKKAILISEDCVFWILHELVNTPYGIKINHINSLDIISYIDSNFRNPVSDLILPLVKDKVSGVKITESRVLLLMENLKKYRCSSIPLNVLYFSTYDESGNIENKYNEVLEYWRTNFYKI